MNSPVLSVRDLSIAAASDGGARPLVRDATFDLGRGEILGLVGESGSGKSMLCRSLVRLLPSRTITITRGSIRLGEQELTGLSDADIRAVRGGRIGMIFQNPTSHLDPLRRIGDQITESVRLHRSMTAAAARAEALAILDQCGFPDPDRQFASYPHEFSGGMRQRAMIAIALSCNPDILIADEPTTALDVTIQAQILQLLTDLRDRRGLSIILITHDLGVVAQTCDRICVMQSGEIVESGDKRQILAAPAHPYTRRLLDSHPTLDAASPAPAEAGDRAGRGRPLLDVAALSVRFPIGGSLLTKRRHFTAVDNVSLQVRAGETVGIVGESGSGKSTLARAVLGLAPVSEGDVIFDGSLLARPSAETRRKLRQQAAMIFQDPLNALNPRMTIHDTLAEVLCVHRKAPAADIPARVAHLLALVGLEPELAARRPAQLSGGQCQRAGIARALAVDPKLIIADECLAALDVTLQAQIVDLFLRLRSEMNLTMLFIAHDLAIVRRLCDRVVVMYRGRIVESGRCEDVFAAPKDPYTARLLAAIPSIDPDVPLARVVATDRSEQGRRHLPPSSS